jgi:tol-pal system-associated acyl-CoA thioesterase
MDDFCIEKKIYFHDTDAGGVVYYGNYLEHLEEGRIELFLSKGVDIRELMGSGIFFPVVHAEMDYKSPARYMDTIRICTHIEKIGTSSISFQQTIFRGAQLLVKAVIVWVCVGADFRPIPVSAQIRKQLLA